jgi:hypothetical protein
MKMKSFKYKYQFIVSLFLLFGAANASAANDAEYVKMQKTYTLNADGSQEYRCNTELTLYSHVAINGGFGETFIVYDPAYQQLKINSSYTKQKDGNIVKTPDNAFVEVLPRQAADAPAYNRLKEMVVVHTGLELGATVYLDYSIISKPGYSSDIDIFEPLRQSVPVKSYTLTVVTPETKKLNYSLCNIAASPSETVSNGKRLMTLNIANLQSNSREPLVSMLNLDQPYFSATTCPSAAEALSLAYKQFALSDNPVVSLKAKVLTESKSDDFEKLSEIVKFVVNDIDNSALTLSETSYRLRSVEEVLSTAYGTEVEKVNLLNALLNAAGLNSEPAAMMKTDVSKGLGLNAVGQYLVVTNVKGKQYLLTPNSLNPSDAYSLSAFAPVYSLKTGQKINIKEPVDYKIRGKYVMTFNNDSLSVKSQTSVGQDLYSYFIKENDVDKAASTKLDMNNGYATVELLEPAKGISQMHYGHLNTVRKSNLMLPRKVDEEYIYDIILPENMSLQTPALNKSITNGVGKVVINVSKSGNTAYIVRSIVLEKQLITPSDYHSFHDLMAEWEGQSGRTLVVKNR